MPCNSNLKLRRDPAIIIWKSLRNLWKKINILSKSSIYISIVEIAALHVKLSYEKYSWCLIEEKAINWLKNTTKKIDLNKIILKTEEQIKNDWKFRLLNVVESRLIFILIINKQSFLIYLIKMHVNLWNLIET